MYLSGQIPTLTSLTNWWHVFFQTFSKSLPKYLIHTAKELNCKRDLKSLKTPNYNHLGKRVEKKTKIPSWNSMTEET